MAVSIRDIQEKIKGFLQNDRLFYGIAGLLVLGLGFGLGRLSLGGFASTPKPFDMVQKTDSRASAFGAEASLSGSASTSTEVGSAGATSAPAVVPLATIVGKGMYVGSRNSDKYHLPTCPGAKHIAEANKVWFASKADAEKAGYKPASNCPGL